jgi:hypothetical protein
VAGVCCNQLAKLQSSPLRRQATRTFFIETFSPNASIEGFNERVIRLFSGPTEVKRDTVGVRPLIQNF